MIQSYGAAVESAIAEEMRRDDRVVCIGNRPPLSIAREFEARVIAVPISEAAMAGMAVGLAESGMRPVVLIRKAAFSFVAFDQIANQAAKLRYMFASQCDLPIVYVLQCGIEPGFGAQHNQSPYAIFAHIPGLKVVLPSTAKDAKALMKGSIRDPNPVVFFQPDRLLTLEAEVGGDEYALDLGHAERVRAGSDVTVVALGYMRLLAEQAADALLAEGISVEIVDPRSLSPLDMDTIGSSVAKTGRLVIVDEAPAMCSMSSEIAARIALDEVLWRRLIRPIVRVTGAPVPVPYSPSLEPAVVPDVTQVTSRIREVVLAEPDHRHRD